MTEGLQSASGTRTAPAALPIFTQHAASATASVRPGRIRSSYSFDPDAALVPAQLVARAEVSALSGRSWGTLSRSDSGIDWNLVAALRAAASERLMRALESAPGMGRDEQQALGRRIIADLLDEEARRATVDGLGAPNRTQQSRLGQAVFDALFRLGRLQPLVDDERVENIIIIGHDTVWLEYEDGRLERGPRSPTPTRN